MLVVSITTLKHNLFYVNVSLIKSIVNGVSGLPVIVLDHAQEDGG